MRTRRPFAIIDRDRSVDERRAMRRRSRADGRPGRAPVDGRSAESGPILLRDPLRPDGLASRPNSPPLRLLAAVFAPSLDRQLASGVPPESGRLLASRAQRLVSPGARRSLTLNWAELAEQARRPPVTRDPRVPICRDRILGAEADLRALLDALAAPRPIGARGVAMARRLLSDGAGPVYYRQSASDLPTALREATAQLTTMSLAERSGS